MVPRPPPKPPALPPTDERGPRPGEATPLRRGAIPGVPSRQASTRHEDGPPIVEHRILAPYDDRSAQPEPVPPPPRNRQPSHRDFDDDEPVTQAGAVEGRVNKRIDRLEDKFERRFDDVELAIKKSDAGARSDTVKTIMAGVVTLVTAVAGSRLVAPEPKPERTVVQRSEAEIEAEVCGKLVDAQEKSICLTGVLNRMVEPAKR